MPGSDAHVLVGQHATKPPALAPLVGDAPPCLDCDGTIAPCDVHSPGRPAINGHHCEACGGLFVDVAGMSTLRKARNSKPQPRVVPEELAHVRRLEDVDVEAHLRSDGLHADHRLDRFGFNHPWLNLLALPTALMVGALISSSEGLMTLFLPAHIMFHELGHAIPCWLSARSALPLPCGITFWNEHQSLFVGLGMAFLFAVLIKRSVDERRPFAAALGGVLMVLLAIGCLIPTEWSFEVTILGGVGGEFWISALALAAFHFRVPDRLRWDFFRFIVVIPAATTWCYSVGLWLGIAGGTERMPTGTIFGGSHDNGGDLNRLISDYGWSPDGLTQFYVALAALTAALLLFTWAQVASNSLKTLRAAAGAGGEDRAE